MKCAGKPAESLSFEKIFYYSSPKSLPKILGVNFLLKQFEMLLPIACAWATEQERIILQSGVQLTTAQLADAKEIGLSRPERVRLLQVEQMPEPNHPVLAAAADATGLISPLTSGLTVRYGIFIRSDCWGNRKLVTHELVHTRQYEQLGSFEAFLRPYFLECLTSPYYPNGPMEQEAVKTSEKICGK